MGKLQNYFEIVSLSKGHDLNNPIPSSLIKSNFSNEELDIISAKNSVELQNRLLSSLGSNYKKDKDELSLSFATKNSAAPRQNFVLDIDDDTHFSRCYSNSRY